MHDNSEHPLFVACESLGIPFDRKGSVNEAHFAAIRWLANHTNSRVRNLIYPIEQMIRFDSSRMAEMLCKVRQILIEDEIPWPKDGLPQNREVDVGVAFDALYGSVVRVWYDLPKPTQDYGTALLDYARRAFTKRARRIFRFDDAKIDALIEMGEALDPKSIRELL